MNSSEGGLTDRICRRLRRVFPALALGALMLFSCHVFFHNKADVDLWGNVGFVKALPWQDAFLRVNTYSFVEPDRPWTNHEWFAEYLYHRVFARAGNQGLLAAKVCLGFLLFGMLLASAQKQRVSRGFLFLWLLLVVSTIGYGFSMRPHLFTYCFFTFLLITLRREHLSQGFCFFILPVLGVLWVNTHGAFFVGALLILFSLLARGMSPALRAAPSYRRLMSGAGLFMLGTCVNPYGPGIWRFIVYSATIYRPFLSEWAGFDAVIYLREHMDFLCVAVFSLVVFFRRRICVADRLFLSAALIAACGMRRNIPLAALAAGVIVPHYVTDPLQGLGRRILRGRAVLAATVLLVAFMGISVWGITGLHKTDPLQIEIPPDLVPEELVAFMRENDIAGNALVFFDWAEYCIWHLYPDCRVFLDGRLCAAYSRRTIRDFFRFLYAEEGWASVLARYPVDIVLIDRRNPVYSRMCALSAWVNIAETGTAALFVKEDRHRELLARLAAGNIRYPQRPPHEYFP